MASVVYHCSPVDLCFNRLLCPRLAENLIMLLQVLVTNVQTLAKDGNADIPGFSGVICLQWKEEARCHPALFNV